MKYLYETHMHTAQVSRCASAPAEEQVRFYKERGFDGIVVTDHFLGGNTTVPVDLPWDERIDLFCRGYELAAEEGKKLGLKVFFGWEFAHLGCDFLTYGLDKAWLKAHPDIDRLEINRYLDLVRSEGAYVVHAHPFREDFYIPYIQLLPRKVDAVEVLNACRKDFENERAAEYAKNYGLKISAGSDNHSAYRQRRLCALGSDKEFGGIGDIIGAIRSGECSLEDIRP
ncbi:MAG: PHP domain-containing protein [Oscillospiraceae bacterium]|nr:PHP domain-containing protein [Oscillospiraceae bacterium]